MWCFAALSMMGSSMAISNDINSENDRLDDEVAIARRNADLYEQKRLDAKRRGNLNILSSRLGAKEFIGQQRASYGASGVKVDSGSTAHMIKDTLAKSDQDALTIAVNRKKEMEAMQMQRDSWLDRSHAAERNRRDKTGAILGNLLSMGSSYGAKSYARR
jgi:hypothetical protein